MSSTFCDHLRQFTTDLGTPQPGTEVSRALRARNPKRVRKEFERVSQGARPRRVPKECAPEFERVQKEFEVAFLFFDSFRTPERTLEGLWGSPALEAPDCFRTLLGFRA